MPRPTKKEAEDKVIRKRLIAQLFLEGVPLVRISRIFKMPLPNLSVLVKEGILIETAREIEKPKKITKATFSCLS